MCSIVRNKKGVNNYGDAFVDGLVGVEFEHKSG